MLDRPPPPSTTWHDAAPAAALGRSPLPVEVAGLPLVLFRDAQNRPAALFDRCPHRGVPLSLGSCDQGLIRCLYHGWTFDSTGACREIPANLTPVAPRRMVDAYPVDEREGRLWVAVPDAE